MIPGGDLLRGIQCHPFCTYCLLCSLQRACWILIFHHLLRLERIRPHQFILPIQRRLCKFFTPDKHLFQVKMQVVKYYRQHFIPWILIKNNPYCSIIPTCYIIFVTFLMNRDGNSNQIQYNNQLIYSKNLRMSSTDAVLDRIRWMLNEQRLLFVLF